MTNLPQHQAHTIHLPSTEILDKQTVQPYRHRLTHGYIANSTLTIAEQALSKCPRLQTLFIPEQVRHIGEWALRGCLSLKQVICLAHPDNFGDKIFSKCKRNLRFLLLSDSLYQDTNPAYWHKHGAHKKALIVPLSRIYEWRNTQPLTLENYDITTLTVLYRLALDEYYKPPWSELAKEYPMLLFQDILLCIHPDKRLKCLPTTMLKDPTPPTFLNTYSKKRKTDFKEQQATLLRNCGLFGNSLLDKIIQIDPMAEFITAELTAKWLCAKTLASQKPDKENLVNR